MSTEKHAEKTVPSDYKTTATEKHAERWAYGHAGIAAAAYVLDPEFHGHKQSSNVEVMEGFLDTLEKIAILVEVCRLDAASDNLKKQWKARAELITADPSKLSDVVHSLAQVTDSNRRGGQSLVGQGQRAAQPPARKASLRTSGS